MTSLQRRQCGREKRNFTGKKPGKHNLNFNFKVNFNSGKSCGHPVPLRGWGEDGTSPLWSPLLKPSTVMRKTQDKSQLRSIPPNTCPVFIKTAKFIKNKESLRSCHSSEEVKET